MRVSLHSTVVACVLLLGIELQGQGMRPDFSKLTPVAMFPGAVEAARSNNISIEGIDAPDATTTRLIPGDSMTGQVTLFEKGGKKLQWLLCVSAAEPTALEKARTNRPPMVRYVGAGDKVEYSHAEAPVTLRILGPFAERSGKGKPPKVEDRTARVNLNEGFLGIGLDQTAAAIYRIRENHLHGRFPVRARPFTDAEVLDGRKQVVNLQLSLEEQRAMVGSDMALDSYADIVTETPGLDGLFYKVASLPSLWSVLWNLGAKVSLNIQFQYVAPASVTNWSLPAGAPCYAYPLMLRINGHPVLMATLVATSPRPPLLGCAGIVGMLAESPSDKETYLTLRFVSARRRPGANSD